MRRFLPLLLLPLFVGGCASTITNLTPLEQTRNATNLYPVEVAFQSRQQTLRWPTLKPVIVVGRDTYEMRPTAFMTNRWEGLVPVPPGVKVTDYHYQFNFQVNRMGQPPTAESLVSPAYTLRIREE